VDEAAALLGRARMPVVIADVELIRFRLQKEFADFLARTGYPFVTLMLGKAVLDEGHPQFIGLYQGDRSRDYVRRRVESADCTLALGAQMTDFNTGGFTVRLDESKTVSAANRLVRVRHHYYENVRLGEFLAALGARLGRRDPAALDVRRATEGCVHRRTEPYEPAPARPLTVQRFFHRLSHFLEPGGVVLAETGVALFSAAETLMPDGTTFIGQTFYGSIGYTVGATLGACLAAPGRRVVLVVGDGSFQVTGQDLSTLIRNGLAPVVFLLNNDGYTIERVICDRPYNDIQPWLYHRLAEVFGGGPGFDVRTEGELEEALARAASSEGLTFIEVHTGRLDCSEALRRAGAAMARTNQLD
jgi:indolepyruvate decarboxylase